jgi:hypothetical protein
MDARGGAGDAASDLAIGVVLGRAAAIAVPVLINILALLRQ